MPQLRTNNLQGKQHGRSFSLSPTPLPEGEGLCSLPPSGGRAGDEGLPPVGLFSTEVFRINPVRPENDTSTLEAEVRDTVEQGNDVREKVRQLTLRFISSRSLDIQSVRQTADAMLRGAQAGVQKELQHSSAQTHIARDHLKQAVTGLDVALAQFAEAAKLAVEEAAGRALGCQVASR